MNKFEFNPLLKLFIFVIFAYLFFLILKPFIPGLILALAFAMIFFPLAKKMRDKWKLGEGISAFLTVVLTLLFIILPLALLITLITREAIDFVTSTDWEALGQGLNSLTRWKILGYEIDLTSLKEQLMSSLSTLGSYASAQGLNILSSISNSLFLFFVFLLLYYYFLKDAKPLITGLQKVLPYDSSEQKKLFNSFREISRTIFYGNTFLALLAGIIAYLGFLVFGFQGAIIWGLLAAIFSFIPTVGTLLIYLAGIGILGFSEGWLAALLMGAYFVVADLLLREAYLRGKILEDKLNFHPIFVFFGLVGGVTAFGSLGLIYGPLIITFLGALYEFYTKELKGEKA